LRSNARDIRADIHVSSAEPLDLLHARELSGFRNIQLHEYPEGGHRLVAEMRDQGKLIQALA